MNEPVLRAMASDGRRFWAAPEAEALAAIYRDVVIRVLCAPEVYWGGR